jgi:energy-coupling factor transporter transmembrane protein EcfT
MDPGINLIFLIIFGLAGFVISKIIGINPYRIFSDITMYFIIILIIVVMFPALINPHNADNIIANLIDVFVNNLPGIIIGDIAGTIISAVTDG